MKRFYVFLISLICSTQLWAQKTELNNGQISLLTDTIGANETFVLSKSNSSDTSLINDVSIWLSHDTGTKSRLSVQKTLGYSNFISGWNTFNASPLVYKTSQPEIKDHQYLYNSNSYNTPSGIANWPTKVGSDNVASFVDLNQNLIYEPQKGDYPFIRGDQCALKLESDARQIAGNFPSIGLRVIQYAYLFPNAGDPLLDNTIGLRWVIKNNSMSDIDSVNFGIHFHSILNRLNTNYVGTDVANHAMYTFSKTDPSNMVSLCLLNRDLEGSIYFKNEGQPNNKNDIPTTDQHFAYFLNGQWKDGDTLKLGSTGIDGERIIDYAFPGKTLSGVSEWTEEKVGNQAGDRHGLLRGKFRDWKADSFKVIEMAIVLSEGINNLDELYQKHASIRRAYKFNQFTTSTKQLNVTKEKVPNPLKKGEIIQFKGDISKVSLFSLSGQKIESIILNSRSIKIPTNLTSGFYLLQFVSSTGMTENRKVYIN